VLFDEIHELALQKNRPDVAEAIQQSFRFSKRIAQSKARSRRIMQGMMRIPVLWRYGEQFYRNRVRRLYAGAIL
jgi:hypothetical protein